MRPSHRPVPILLAVLAFALGGCAGEKTGVTTHQVDLTKPVAVDVTRPMPTHLSDLNLFAWDAVTARFTFHEDVVPYDVNAALFSDYAQKQRAIYVPPGSSASFDPELAFDFPIGSVIIKNFSFPADFRAPNENVRVVETRLLVRFADGWQGFPYIWNDAQTDAILSPAGEVRAISFIAEDGASQTSNYLIPQRNQCVSCHARKPDLASPAEMTLIGIKARHLHRDYDYGGTIGIRNQLTRLADAGFLTGLPALGSIVPAYDLRPVETGGVSAIPAADVERAARDYLDINCAHCHNPLGVQGITSQLFLQHDETDPFHLGVCKMPGSAGAGTGGFSFDVVPGDPDTSILSFRVATTDVGAMMPLLGRSLQHVRGAELVRAWIAAMPAQTCQ